MAHARPCRRQKGCGVEYARRVKRAQYSRAAPSAGLTNGPRPDGQVLVLAPRLLGPVPSPVYAPRRQARPAHGLAQHSERQRPREPQCLLGATALPPPRHTTPGRGSSTAVGALGAPGRVGVGRIN